jgi:hypothetical protein|tara:strand:- start:1248 stop:1412 length:165 start_codon:yes stop_codon:yes gene_type:complete
VFSWFRVRAKRKFRHLFNRLREFAESRVSQVFEVNFQEHANIHTIFDTEDEDEN